MSSFDFEACRQKREYICGNGQTLTCKLKDFESIAFLEAPYQIHMVCLGLIMHSHSQSSISVLRNITDWNPPWDAFKSRAHWVALNSDLNAHKRICTCTYNRGDGKLSVKRSHTFLISITALPERAMVKLKGRGCEVERKKREVPSGEFI